MSHFSTAGVIKVQSERDSISKSLYCQDLVFGTTTDRLSIRDTEKNNVSEIFIMKLDFKCADFIIKNFFLSFYIHELKTQKFLLLPVRFDPAPATSCVDGEIRALKQAGPQ